jgi:hypothetical protein
MSSTNNKPHCLVVVIDNKGDERLGIAAELKKIESNLPADTATDQEKENLLRNIRSALSVDLSCRGVDDVDAILKVYIEEQA